MYLKKIFLIKKHYICQIRISVGEITWEFSISRILNSLKTILIILINVDSLLLFIGVTLVDAIT